MVFRTPHESGFLVFGVSNAKYLTFDTPDGNALITITKINCDPHKSYATWLICSKERTTKGKGHYRDQHILGGWVNLFTSGSS